MPLVFALLAAPAHAAQIAYRQVDSDNFVFRLRNDTALDESTALGIIGNAARSVCGQRQPRLGKYTFESKQPLSQDSVRDAPANFEFILEVACIAAVPGTPSAAPPGRFTKEEKDKAAADVLDKTERFFRLLAAGNVDEAYKDIDQSAMQWNETAWKKARRDFVTVAGALQRIEITKVTVYENPQGAPVPGLYVAADFRNVWLNVPVHCGYLMWLRTAAGDFLVTREETGHVTEKDLQAMPPQDRQQVARALQCR